MKSRIYLAIIFICIMQFVNSSPESYQNLQCSFKRDMCSWYNVKRREGQDDFNWKWRKAQRQSSVLRKYGQWGDHTNIKKSGYAYIPSSLNNGTAILKSPVVTLYSDRCFQFWYSMNGGDIGHLAVIKLDLPQKTQEIIWKLQGHQATYWQKGSVLISSNSQFILMFEAFDWEQGKNGTIAIDDITVTSADDCTKNEVTSQEISSTTAFTTSTKLNIITTTTIAKTTIRTTSPEPPTSRATKSNGFTTVKTLISSPTTVESTNLSTQSQQTRSLLPQTTVNLSTKANFFATQNESKQITTTSSTTVIIVITSTILLLLACIGFFIRRYLIKNRRISYSASMNPSYKNQINARLDYSKLLDKSDI